MRLGDNCSKIGSGATPRGGKAAYLEQGPYSLIRSQNIFNDTFAYSGLAYISDEQAEQLSNVAIEKNDVLLNITGDSVARVCQVPIDTLPARVNQHVAIIRPNPSKLYHRFLRYYLVSPSMQNHMLMLASAGATRNALTKGVIEDFEIPSFPLSDQKAIASVLSALDDKMESNRRMNETLEEMARAIFKSWFVDFDPVCAKAEGKQPAHMDAETAELFPSSFGDDGLPVGWRGGAAADLIEFNPKEKLTKGVKAIYIEMSNLPTQGPVITDWALREFKSGTKFRNGDTLFARITPCLENGKTAFVDVLDEGEIAWGSTEYIVMRSKNGLPPPLSYVLARNDAFREHAKQSMTGTSGRQRAQADVVANFSLVVADAEVYTAFGQSVDIWFDKIAQNADENSTLALLRDTLLPKLMSGDIRIKDAEKEVESVA